MGTKKRNNKKKKATADDGDVPDTKSVPIEPVDDDTPLIPSALLSRVLDYTSQRTVLRVAGVCRGWRAVAQAHKLFYAHVCLEGDGSTTPSEYLERSKTFVTTLHEALQCFQRLSVSVLSPFGNDDIGTPDFNNEMVADTLALGRIAAFMPNIFELWLSLPRMCSVSVEMFLCKATAPVLEKLEFEFDGDDGPGPFAPLPHNLFMGTAPALKTVRLNGVELTAKPVRAFANARRVSLNHYSSDSLPFIAPNFPGMTHLDLDFLDLDYDERYPGLGSPSPAVRSLGARLQHLELSLHADDLGLPTLLQNILEKHAIPSITLVLDAESPSDFDSEQFATFLCHVSKPFRVVLRRERSYGGPTAEDMERRPRDTSCALLIEVYSLGSRFKRVFRAEWIGDPDDASEAALLERLPDLAPHIRELEVADVLLPELFKEVDSLPRLKYLTITFDSPTMHGPADVLEHFAHQTGASLDCPNVETITLRCAMPYWPTVHDSDVAAVIRKFKAGSTPPALKLSGVRLDLTDADAPPLDGLIAETAGLALY